MTRTTIKTKNGSDVLGFIQDTLKNGSLGKTSTSSVTYADGTDEVVFLGSFKLVNNKPQGIFESMVLRSNGTVLALIADIDLDVAEFAAKAVTLKPAKILDLFTAFKFVGNDGDDVATGGSKNDSFFGDAGNDTLSGQAGDDDIIGGAGADILSGGDGVDLVSYVKSSAGVTVTLRTRALRTAWAAMLPATRSADLRTSPAHPMTIR